MRKRDRAYRKIRRDKERKLQKSVEEKQKYTVQSVFAYKNIIKSAVKSTKNVSWKASVQRYELNALSKTFADYRVLRTGAVPKCMSGREITITERGKSRTITPIHIKDRVLQKTLCDNALVPVITKKLIYDNGASLEGKGVRFSRMRMLKHLKAAVREYGTAFYGLTYDSNSFFDSIPHRECRKSLERYFDKDLANIAMEIIKNPLRAKAGKLKDREEKRKRLADLEIDRTCGICLGSQESQTMALIVPNRLDHFVKDRMRIKHYIRYMDDGIVLARTKEELQDLLSKMKKIMAGLGMRFNEKKTRIVKARRGFTFLKVKYHISETGKTIRRLTAKGIIRMRRKLKKFRAKVDEGKLTLDNVYDSIQSWLAHTRVAKSFRTVRNMLRLYRRLFNGYRLGKHREDRNALQAGQREKYRWSCDGI